VFFIFSYTTFHCVKTFPCVSQTHKRLMIFSIIINYLFIFLFSIFLLIIQIKLMKDKFVKLLNLSFKYN